MVPLWMQLSSSQPFAMGQQMGCGQDDPCGASTARNHSIRRDPCTQILARFSCECYLVCLSRTAVNDRDRSFGMASSDRTYGRWQLARWPTLAHRRGPGTYHPSTLLSPSSILFLSPHPIRGRPLCDRYHATFFQHVVDHYHGHTHHPELWVVRPFRPLDTGHGSLCSRSSGWHQIVACS